MWPDRVSNPGPLVLESDAMGKLPFDISLFFLPLSLGDGTIKTEILSQTAVKPKQNQPIIKL